MTNIDKILVLWSCACVLIAHADVYFRSNRDLAGTGYALLALACMLRVWALGFSPKRLTKDQL